MTTTRATYTLWPIDEIHIENRIREDLGDLEPLSESIRAVGLMHPPVVMRDGRLVAGERRVAACRLLGKTSIQVTVAADWTDALRLRAEGDENTCRKDLSPLEKKALADRLRPELEAEAKARQREGQERGREAQRTGERGSRRFSGNASETRDLLAKAVGTSTFTLGHIDKVVEAAEKDPSLAPVVEEMERTGKVHPAYCVAVKGEKPKNGRAKKPANGNGKRNIEGNVGNPRVIPKRPSDYGPRLEKAADMIEQTITAVLHELGAMKDGGEIQGAKELAARFQALGAQLRKLAKQVKGTR